MNKTAYLVALAFNNSLILYVTSTTGGEERAIAIFNQAFGYKTNIAKVILTRPDVDAQRMQNTVASFARTSDVVRNLRKNRISNDEAAQKDLICGVTISAIRAQLKATADFNTSEAKEHLEFARKQSAAARRKF